jgi:hypothetical protein
LDWSFSVHEGAEKRLFSSWQALEVGLEVGNDKNGKTRSYGEMREKIHEHFHPLIFGMDED